MLVRIDRQRLARRLRWRRQQQGERRRQCADLSFLPAVPAGRRGSDAGTVPGAGDARRPLERTAGLE